MYIIKEFQEWQFRSIKTGKEYFPYSNVFKLYLQSSLYDPLYDKKSWILKYKIYLGMCWWIISVTITYTTKHQIINDSDTLSICYFHKNITKYVGRTIDLKRKQKHLNRIWHLDFHYHENSFIIFCTCKVNKRWITWIK